MLRGELAGLRARHDSDVPVFDSELHDDVETRVRSIRKLFVERSARARKRRP